MSGTPTVKLGGAHTVVGGFHNGTMYPTYRDTFERYKTLTSDFEIEPTVTYDSATRQGTVDVKVRNTSGSSAGGLLHVVLVESHKYYLWQGLDSLHHLERAMYPDAGETVTIPANDSLTRTRNFTLDASWVPQNCHFVVFIQNTSNRQILQGAKAAVRPTPELKFAGIQPDGLTRPNTSVSFPLSLSNRGTSDVSGGTATVSTTDPYLLVTGPSSTFGPIPVGGVVASNSQYALNILPGCPDPYMAWLFVDFTGTDYETTDSFPMVITATPGFADQMEGGVNGWTHSGYADQWHQTTHRSNSSSHSWYCGTEGTWQYTNDNDAVLVTPYFSVGEPFMTFYQYYRTEAGYDYCMVEVNNGSDFWAQLASYNGNGASWQLVSRPLTGLQFQTVRLRFRFISDGSVVDEGWYVDDLYAGLLSGIAAPESQPTERLSLASGQNPVRDVAELRYQIPPGAKASVAIYDVAGSRVAEYGGLSATGRLNWNLTDASGAQVRNGTFFARLAALSGSSSVRIVVAR